MAELVLVKLDPKLFPLVPLTTKSDILRISIEVQLYCPLCVLLCKSFPRNTNVNDIDQLYFFNNYKSC